MWPPDDLISEEEYLVREPEAEYKSEFHDGRVVAMSGGSWRHSRIIANLGWRLNEKLAGRDCDVVTGEARIKVAAARFYTYPDIVIVCGAPQFLDPSTTTLLNPTVIMEVLSPSTQAYDRGAKFEYYKQLETLREYVLVYQDERKIEHYVRLTTGVWACRVIDQPEDALRLETLPCELLLADVYFRT